MDKRMVRGAASDGRDARDAWDARHGLGLEHARRIKWIWIVKRWLYCLDGFGIPAASP